MFAWRTMLQRLSMAVLGLVLARYIPSRTLRRVLRVTVIPAVVAFVLQRVQRARGRRPDNKTSPAALR
jgi:uncharacterized membrane protein YfcA